MTDQVQLTYIGRFKQGIQTLPGRHVPFELYQPTTFTAAEAALLDPAEWSGPRPTL